MAQKMTFLGLIREVLNRTDRPLTPREIWNKAVTYGLDEKLNSKGETPWVSVSSKIHQSVRGESSAFVKIGSYPALFYLKERENEMLSEEQTDASEEAASPKREQSAWKERDLDPLLTHYVYENPHFGRGRKIYTKAIYHEKSSGGGFSEWVYPDMVGCYLPANDFESKVLDLCRERGDSLMHLYSFEIKKSLGKKDSNYREAFFQAVANSSWANEGYLVTAEIKDDKNNLLFSELRRLSASFGIGLIFINPADMASSEIIFPATPKKRIDWETVNKLCKENECFRNFIKDLKTDSRAKEIHDNKYEQIMKMLELKKHIRKKKIIKNS